MNLNLEIGIDTSLLSNKLGKDKYNELKLTLLSKSEYTCSCCKWQPKEYEKMDGDENYLSRMKNYFMTHVQSEDEKNVKEEDASIVCRSCFCIKHIEKAVGMGYVKFVNSKFDQKGLIKISWSDFSQAQIIDTNRERAEIQRDIISLKKDPNFYLDKIKDGAHNDKLKVVFTDKFFDYNIKYEKY